MPIDLSAGRPNYEESFGRYLKTRPARQSREGFAAFQRADPGTAGMIPQGAGLSPETLAKLKARPAGVSEDQWSKIVTDPESFEALSYNTLANIEKSTGFDTESWQRIIDSFTKAQAEGSKYLEGAGDLAKTEAKRNSLRNAGEIDQDLIDRGFHSSSLRDMLQLREKESLGRTNAQIDEGVRGQRLNFDTQWATTMGQTMAARPNPYQPLANVYNMALQTRLQPRTGQSSSLSGIGSILGGAGSLALGLAAFSERSLKTDIERIGTRPDGIGLYRFRYVWGGPEHVGVMADEVEKVRPDAIVRMGTMRLVNYAAL